MSRARWCVVLVCGVALAAAAVAAQSVARPDYDVGYLGPPLADPVLQHAKETYVLFGCAYCHGLELVPRGEATDLRRSPLVGQDQNANLIGPLLRAGIQQTAKLSPMPQFADLSDQQLTAIARWIHYARQRARYSELVEVTGSTGDAAAGRAYFARACASCHSTTGDLAGIGGKYDAATLRAQVLEPKSLRLEPSYRVDRLRDVRMNAARDRHLSLLENYSAQDVANLVAYLREPR
jgi:cytochrome c oxidase cbb3-type subunit III